MPEDSTTEEVNTQDPASAADDTGSDTSTEEAAANPGNDRAEDTDDIFDDEPSGEQGDSPADEKGAGTEGEESPEKPSFDEDLDEWAEKTGRGKPQNDRERQLLQDMRNGQREFTKTRQAEKGAKDLGSAIKDIAKDANVPTKEEPTDPTERRFAALERSNQEERTARLQSEFYQARNIGESTGKVMSDIIREKVSKASTLEGKQRALDHWSHPDQLDDLYELALARESNASGKDAIAEQAAAKERERIAKETKAAGPTRNAKTTQPASKKDPLDELWDKD